MESMNQVAKQLNNSQVTHYFLPLLKRLTTADWFTGRISACGLYATVYSKCTAEQQNELRTAFAQLIQDDTPMVKRAAAKALVVRFHLLIEIYRLIHFLFNGRTFQRN